MSPLLRALRPPRSLTSKRRLIVTEEGARGFDAFVLADEADDTVVVAQGAEEAPVELPSRVMGRLALIERAGWTVNRAVIVVAPKHDSESWAARKLVAHSLLTHMGAAGGGELALAAYEPEAALRHDLLSLVETLLVEHERTPVTLRLRFHCGESTTASRIRSARKTVVELTSPGQRPRRAGASRSRPPYSPQN